MVKQACKLILISWISVVPVSAGWADFNIGTVRFTGNLGYSLRDLNAKDGRDTTSNQLQGTLTTNTYIWQPWFATTALRLTAVKENTDVRNENSTQTDLLTGDAALTLLPQSHTPFQLNYRASDTRVDRVSLQQVPVSFPFSSGFSSDRLALKQSVMTDGGHRFQVRYDNSHWESNAGGAYDDEELGAEADLRLVKNRLTARVSQQNSQNAFVAEEEDRFIINIEHDYVPNVEWRIDNFLNILNEERTPFSGTVSTTSTVDSHQLSSFAFWRPDKRPFTISGGVRIYGIDASNNTFGSTQESISGSLGGFYQYNKNLRFDGSVTASQIDPGVTSITQTQQRIGFLYQSDVAHLGKSSSSESALPAFLDEVFSVAKDIIGRGPITDKATKPWVYQWYSDGALANRTASQGEDIASLTAGLGHNLNRSWRQTERSFFNMGLSQLLTELVTNGNEDNVTRLTQSGNFSWNHIAAAGADSSAQLSMSDSRDLNNSGENRQLFNLQLSHNMPMSRQSNLLGSLTAQHVQQNHEVLPDTNVTSISGRLKYQHNRIFSVPQLGFLSELYISKAELSNSLDRAEWENRLSYIIGQTESQLSFKWIDSGSLQYTLLYFRVIRKF